LRSLPEKVAKRLLRLLDTLEDDPWPDNLDVTALAAHRPWMRVRDGNYRLFIRPLTDTELSTLDVELPDTGYLVARVIDKKDAVRVVKGLR
jgi:hypothetical protein